MERRNRGGERKKMLKLFRKNRSGVSTVIATIIIVAISIVMAIAVAYWALGIGGSFTRFEKIQFTSAYVTVNTDLDPDQYEINVDMKNTGTATATIDQIFINGQPYDSYLPLPTDDIPDSAVLEAGKSVQGVIALQMAADGDWQSGMVIEVSVQTAAGNSYPKTVTLP